MNDDLSKTIGVLGASCIIVAVVGGDVTLAGSDFPAIASPSRQFLLAAVGVALTILAYWWRTSRVGVSRSRPLVVFLVEQKMASISSAAGSTPDGQPHVRTTGGGIKTRRIEAADYSRSDDGKRYTFKDRDGRVVCELPSYQVHTIRRAKASD